MVLRHLLIQGVHGAHWHLDDQPVQELGPAEAVVAVAGLVGQHYCLPMKVVDLRPILPTAEFLILLIRDMVVEFWNR